MNGHPFISLIGIAAYSFQKKLYFERFGVILIIPAMPVIIVLLFCGL
jgi:hypothetical protein